MSKFAPLVLFALLAATPAAAQNWPDLRGTWTGDSESITWGKSNPHQTPANQTDQARLVTVPFTLKVDKQDGRRFSATLTSERKSETLVGVISRTGTIFIVDDDGADFATLLGPDRMEVCHMTASVDSRVASCAEFTRQP